MRFLCFGKRVKVKPSAIQKTTLPGFEASQMAHQLILQAKMEGRNGNYAKSSRLFTEAGQLYTNIVIVSHKSERESF